MKVFTCNDFEGHWPVGSAAVMVANTASEAREMLGAWLEENNLPQTRDFSVEELLTQNRSIRVLVDGEY